MVVISREGPPETGIRHVEENTMVFFNEKCLGPGTLYISESRVSWVGSAAGQTFSLMYHHIALHAIQRQPRESLYLMINVRFFDSEGEESESEGDEQEDQGMTECRFIPQDTSKLQQMFDAMRECQMLNPDSSDLTNSSGEDDEDNEDDAENGNENQEGMFDDAEEPAEDDAGNAPSPMES